MAGTDRPQATSRSSRSEQLGCEGGPLSERRRSILRINGRDQTDWIEVPVCAPARGRKKPRLSGAFVKSG